MPCAEAGWLTAGCNGNESECNYCKKTFCWYHAPPNVGGSVGGHSSCSGPRCSVVVGGVTCGGHVSKCERCELIYCQNHIEYGGMVPGDGGHACDIECDTTAHTKKFCSGKKQDRKQCACGYKFCAYHYMPVATIITPVGGHVCKAVTWGSAAIGDNVCDYLTLVVNSAKAWTGDALPLQVQMANNIFDATFLTFLNNGPLGKSGKVASEVYLAKDDQTKATKQKELAAFENGQLLAELVLIKTMVDGLITVVKGVQSIKECGPTAKKEWAALYAKHIGKDPEQIVNLKDAATSVLGLIGAANSVIGGLVKMAKA